jgi:hypothetical protein
LTRALLSTAVQRGGPVAVRVLLAVALPTVAAVAAVLPSVDAPAA